MTDHSHQGGRSATSCAVIWPLSRATCIVWCSKPEQWRRVQRWSFSSPFATAWKHGVVVARAFTIPKTKVRFAQRALGMEASRRQPTANQAAYYAKLRVRAARGDLFGPTNAHERRSNGAEMARTEAQP